MNLKKTNLTIKEMKEISTIIIQEESKKEDIPISVTPVILKEFYKTDFIKNDLKLLKGTSKYNLLKTPITCLGTNYTNINHIFLFLGTFCLNKIGEQHQLVDLIKLSYHEFCHTYQLAKINDYSLMKRTMIMGVDKTIKEFNPNHYKKYHDEYLQEIDADQYGINKTIEFLRRVPNIYKEEKDYLKKVQVNIEFRLKNYDFDFFFEEYYQNFKNNINTHYKDFTHFFPFCILWEQNSYKFDKLENILSNQIIFDIDELKEFLYLFITSKTFLSQLELSKLTSFEKDKLKEAIEYSLSQEIEKQNYNQNLLKTKLVEKNLILNKLEKNKNKINFLYATKLGLIEKIANENNLFSLK